MVRNQVHGRGMCYVNLRVIRHGLAKLALHVEDAIGELGGGVWNELSVNRIKHLNVGFQCGEIDGFPAAHKFGDAVADDLKTAGGVIHSADDPLRVADDDASAGCGNGALEVRHWCP